MHGFFVGNEVKYIFRSVFSFLSKVLWLKELWARVIFKWDCGTFWEALQKTIGVLREGRGRGVQDGSGSTMS